MLDVKNLTFKVNENGIERSIVKNISFGVDDGEMLVITGPNGGGKSSLAKVLMGIEEADSGQIILDGEDITSYDINHRANAGIGFAFIAVRLCCTTIAIIFSSLNLLHHP